MRRPVTVVGAPSSIGIRPYADGGVRRIDRAPGVLREQGLVARLGARDAGDVYPPPYRDFERPPGRARNEDGVRVHARALARAVAEPARQGSLVLLLGGDCSILLGALGGARRAAGRPIGLAYLDAHADFATPSESRTGSVASMDLALATGRGSEETPLARLGGQRPLVRAGDVALVGRRDDADAWYGHDALRSSGVLDLPGARLRDAGPAAIAAAVLERVARQDLGGFWIHLDADLLDPSIMPAVDAPEPDGLGLDDAVALLAPLVRHPRALGMQLTIYDPALDPGHVGAATLVTLLVRVFADGESR